MLHSRALCNPLIAISLAGVNQSGVKPPHSILNGTPTVAIRNVWDMVE